MLQQTVVVVVVVVEISCRANVSSTVSPFESSFKVVYRPSRRLGYVDDTFAWL
jgi:hypothetical protein